MLPTLSKNCKWILFIIVAAETAGISRICKTRLHFLLFLSVTLSRYYDVDPLTVVRVTKERGLFYSGVRKAISTLNAHGMIDLRRGEVRPTIEGLSASKKLQISLADGRLYKFLTDLCLAIVSAFPESVDEPIGNESNLPNKVIDVTLATVVKGIKQVEMYMSESRPVNRRDVLDGYMKLVRARASAS